MPTSAATRTAFAALCCIGLTGCASMVEGTIEPSGEILITSTPAHAEVWQRSRFLCETPCHVAKADLPSREHFVVRFSSGARVEVGPDASFNPNILGNLIFGGGIGVLIDTASGRLVRRGDRIHIVEPAPSVAATVSPGRSD